MKQLLIAGLALILVIPACALAEDGPHETMENIVASLKKTPGIAGIADFVHWETAFNEVPAPQRQEMGITSAQELRKFYIEAQSDPGAIIRRQMKQRGVPPQQADVLEQQIAALSQNLKQRMQQQHERVMRTKFEIGDTEIHGDEAKIALTTTLDGKSKEDVVTLKNYDGHWLLPGLSFLEPEKSAAPTSQGPAASTQ